MKRIWSWIFVLLLVVSVMPVEAVTKETKETKTCSAANPELCTAGQLGLIWNKIVKPTAEQFSRLEPPDEGKFGKLAPEQQAIWLSNPANLGRCLECAHAFYSNSANVGKNPKTDDKYFSGEGNLFKSQAAANVYLNTRFRAPGRDVKFVVTEKMTYTEDKGLCVGDQCLSSQAGESSPIPKWTDTIRYDEGTKEFILEPRGRLQPGAALAGMEDVIVGVRIEGNVRLGANGIIMLDAGARIVDALTGATLYAANEETSFRFVENGFQVKGEADGTWTDFAGFANSFVNFEGTLTYSDKVLSAQNADVKFQDKRIEGQFVAQITDNRLSFVSLLSEGSSLTDSEGKIVVGAGGSASLRFDSTGAWDSLEATSTEVEYGNIRNGVRPRQHYFRGDFTTLFKKDGELSSTILRSKDSIYRDNFQRISVTSRNDNTAIWFGIDTEEDRRALLDSPYSVSTVTIGSGPDIRANGLVTLDVGELRYEALQSSAEFTYKLVRDEEQVHIDGKEDGAVARLFKKIDIGARIHEKFYIGKIQGGISMLISREAGKLGVELDQASLGLLGKMEEGGTLFAILGRTLILDIGDEDARMVIGAGLGIRYEAKGKGINYFLSPDAAKSRIGNEVMDVNEEIGNLNKQISELEARLKAELAGKTLEEALALGWEPAAQLLQLTKRRDGIEFLLHHYNIQGLINARNFDEAIKQTEKFLTDRPGTQIESEVKLSMAELLLARSREPVEAASTKEGGAMVITVRQTPGGAWAGRSAEDETKTVIYPPGAQWLTTSDDVNSYGDVDFYKVGIDARGNKRLLQWYGKDSTSWGTQVVYESGWGYDETTFMSGIGGLGGSFTSQLYTTYIQEIVDSSAQKVHNAREADYQAAVGIYRGLVDHPEHGVESRISLAGTYLQKGEARDARDEFRKLTDHANAEVRSQGYTGMALSLSNLPGSEEALLSALGSALEANPDNEMARLMQRQMQQGVMTTVSRRLQAEIYAASTAVRRKLGIEGWTEGVISWQGLGQIFGNTGRVITDPITGYSDALLSLEKSIQAQAFVHITGIQEMDTGSRNSKLEYSLQDYRNAYRHEVTTDAQGRRIELNTLLDMVRKNHEGEGLTDRQVFLLSESVRAALHNNDIILAAHNGAPPRRQDAYYFEREVSSSFVFKSDTRSYFSKEGLEYTWRDELFDGVDLKNFAMLVVPGSQMGALARVGIVARAGILAETTVAGLFLRGLAAGGRGLIGVEASANIARGAGAIRHTLGSSKIGQFLLKEYGTRSRFFDKSVSWTAQTGRSVAAEELAGNIASTIVGVIKPEWGEAAYTLTTMLSGHRNVVRRTMDRVEFAARTTAEDTRRLIYGQGGRVIGESVGTFTTRKARDEFIQELRDARRAAGESFDDLSNGAFRMDGRTYHAAADDVQELVEISRIGGVGAADIAILDARQNAEDILAKATRSMDDSLIRKVDREVAHTADYLSPELSAGKPPNRRNVLDDYADIPKVSDVGEDVYFNYFEEMVDDRTKDFVNSFNPALQRTKRELADMLPDATITGRLKEAHKVEEKIFRDLSKGSISSRDEVFYTAGAVQDSKLRDVAGTRATFNNLDEIADASKLIEQRIASGEWTRIDHKRWITQPRPGSGYRAEHWIVAIEGRPVEIQLRTREQNIWSDWGHDKIYKGALKDNPVALQYSSDMGDWVYGINRGIPTTQPPCPPVLRALDMCFSLPGR